jgi:hypothetical protein
MTADLERAWQALSLRQRDWIADGPEFLDLDPASARAIGRLEPPVVEPVPGDATGRAYTRTPWGVEVAAYTRDRKPRARGSGPVSPRPSRSRRDCEVCGKSDLAVVKGGALFAHYTPGGEQCKGGLDSIVPGRPTRGPVAEVSARIPAPVHDLVRAAAKSLGVECRDIAAEALARIMVARAGLSEVEAREVWRVPERLAVPTVAAQALAEDDARDHRGRRGKAVGWSLPAPGVLALDAGLAEAGPFVLHSHRVEPPASRSRAVRLALWALFWDGEGVPPWSL